jgi:TolB-like protein
VAEARAQAIAVLPFQPIHPDTRDESLELGLADALITQLSAVDRFVVTSTSAIRQFTGIHRDPVVAGRTLRVDLVLEGSVQRADRRVRATARLVDVASGRAMWATMFNEHARDTFALLDAISSRIVRGLLRQMDTTPNDRPIDHIRELTRNWSPGQFERSYAPGKWTARQILIHLAQTEIGLGNRARMALTSPQYTAQPFDHEAWVARETSLSGQAAVEALTGLNRMNQSFFASLSRAELSTPFMHPDYGALTVEWIVHLLASHLTHHLAQLEQIDRAEEKIG